MERNSPIGAQRDMDDIIQQSIVGSSNKKKKSLEQEATCISITRRVNKQWHVYSMTYYTAVLMSDLEP